MAWPTSKPDSTAFDADSDRISTSRAELKTMSDAVNDIVDFVDTTGITNGQALIYDSTSGTLKAGNSGARSSYGTRQNLGTFTTNGPHNVTMTGDFAYIAFNVATGTTIININVEQNFDTEYTIIAHRFTTDSNSTVTINITDTDSATGYTYTSQGVGAIGTKIFFSKLTSSEAGRTLYMIDNLSIDSSA